MKKSFQKKKKIYLNKAQNYIFQIAPKNLYVVGSRRSGKTHGVAMPVILRNVQAMPKSNGAIVATTYKQALTRTLPGTFHALSELNYIEGIHYFVGRRAPKSANFKEPYIIPRSWDYVIHWYNGSIMTLISQDIPFSSNSLTFDYVVGDEAKTLNHDKLVNEVLPANSGLRYFRDCPWHTGVNFFSDMPTNKAGEWLLKKIEDMDPELLELVEGIIYNIWVLKNKPNSNLPSIQAKINSLMKELDFFRKKLSLFFVMNVLDNIEVVGVQYLEDMFRNLPPHVFLSAILSLKVRNVEGLFYAALDKKKHYYTAINNSFLNSFRKTDGSIDFRKASNYKYDCKQDEDINPNLPLYIAFDTNININWLIVGQPDYTNNKLKILNSLYVKSPMMLPELLQLFVNYYSTLSNKHVVFYYDHTFLQGKSAISSESFSDTIIKILSENKWFVSDIYIGQAERHDRKHKAIDMSLKGQQGLIPQFNELNNEALLIALEKTGTKVSVRGWGKDKSKEKLPDTEENPVEHRTDGTDAFDTLFLGCNNFPQYFSENSIKLSTEVM